eukprot:CAMPEP_0202363370 /NCGR_PEP_ID=MMETSP1126-20121109/15195_1 /ASSEMBLY_ACC=CAM_ASM_000457 /TAXON_ID=3047 /ORGANISM="Dunaliella tertiolecta, Strain CCMP1320" /LENGTH=50 /DNA_ID=CAMNT_0048957779 /DNA_START=455 /DNA_END=607 /DNA_ORIENTATION=-
MGVHVVCAEVQVCAVKVDSSAGTKSTDNEGTHNEQDQVQEADTSHMFSKM